MKTIVYDGELETTNKIFDEYPTGNLSVICPKCKEEAIVVLDADDIKKHNRAPGIYCRNGHFWTVFNYRS